jgi:hypothetical protein
MARCSAPAGKIPVVLKAVPLNSFGGQVINIHFFLPLAVWLFVRDLLKPISVPLTIMS